jgi:V8-like Glu-specific endopeptidase
MRLLPSFRHVALSVALSVVAAPAHAEERTAPAATIEPPRLPGVGAHDPRIRIDPNTAPWRAVGKLQSNVGSFYMSCTGTLVGPSIVLTAAHCLYSPRTQNYLPASAFHFLIGYDGDEPAAHAVGRRFVIGAGFDPKNPMKTPSSDWALLTLDSALGTADRRLTLLDHPPEVGAAIMIGGYSQDRRYVITADSTCHILGWSVDNAGRRLIRHDCAGTRGVSGAPVLVQDILAAVTGAGGYAVMLDDIRSRL